MGRPPLLLGPIFHTPNSGRGCPGPAHAGDVGMPVQNPIGARVGIVEWDVALALILAGK